MRILPCLALCALYLHQLVYWQDGSLCHAGRPLMKTRSFLIREGLFYSWGQRKPVPHGQKQKNTLRNVGFYFGGRLQRLEVNRNRQHHVLIKEISRWAIRKKSYCRKSNALWMLRLFYSALRFCVFMVLCMNWMQLGLRVLVQTWKTSKDTPEKRSTSNLAYFLHALFCAPSKHHVLLISQTSIWYD